jgi:hypothetical protein
VRPISTHLRIIPDYCSWRGYLVLAGNQTTPIHDANPYVGQPQANLWFGISDDLWRFGKPAGWGGPWRNTAVTAGEPSDPFLMTGYEHKVIHLTHDAAETVTFEVDVDFLGDGSWCLCETVEVEPGGYSARILPTGFSAHWVRVRASVDCRATAQLCYT